MFERRIAARVGVLNIKYSHRLWVTSDSCRRITASGLSAEPGLTTELASEGDLSAFKGSGKDFSWVIPIGVNLHTDLQQVRGPFDVVIHATYGGATAGTGFILPDWLG